MTKRKTISIKEHKRILKTTERTVTSLTTEGIKLTGKVADLEQKLKVLEQTLEQERKHLIEEELYYGHRIDALQDHNKSLEQTISNLQLVISKLGEVMGFSDANLKSLRLQSNYNNRLSNAKVNQTNFQEKIKQ